MRWASDYALHDQRGMLRVVRRFLWWPRTFNSKRTRWLETAWIVEQVHEWSDWTRTGFSWVAIGFADEPLSSGILLHPGEGANGRYGLPGTGIPIYDIHIADLRTGYPDIRAGQVLSLQQAIMREMPVVRWEDRDCPVAVFRRPPIPAPDPPSNTAGTNPPQLLVETKDLT